MPIKNPLHRFQPAPLYVVLILSICYFCVQLILSHFSHALTLLMASYHMLCNIFALAGSIVTIKHNELHNENEKLHLEDRMKAATSVQCVSDSKSPESNVIDNGVALQLPEEEARLRENKRRELRTRNTFGWARIEILTMLIVCITLASLSFSLLVEALQTLVHIDHQDSMHYPVHVMILGFVGLLLNGFTYLLIGGYTLHQGNFLHINPKGNVVVEPSNISVEGQTLAKNSSSNADHQLKEDLQTEVGRVHYRTRREGSSEFLRDVSSTIFVIVCAIIVYYAVDKDHTAKFIDPILAIFSCVMVVALSYPYMKESCLILLQTIPGSIDMENFERTLITKFPQIVSYHDLHIWQLSSHKFVATVHIIFQSPKLYEKTIEDVRSHFQDHSIMHVTIQPEFQISNTSLETGATTASTECLMQCQNPDCVDKVCCKDSFNDLREVSVCGAESTSSGKKSGRKHSHGHGHGHSHDHGHGHGHAHDHSKLKHKSHKVLKNLKCSGHEHKTEDISNNSKISKVDPSIVPEAGEAIIQQGCEESSKSKCDELEKSNKIDCVDEWGDSKNVPCNSLRETETEEAAVKIDVNTESDVKPSANSKEINETSEHITKC